MRFLRFLRSLRRLRFLRLPPRTPGPGRARARVPMLLLVVAVPAVALPPGPAAETTGPRFVPAVRTEAASPATTGPDQDAEGTYAERDDGPVWPLAGGPAVVRGWEPPENPYGPGHRGVDLAARPGAVVLAAATGRVSFAGPVAGRGVLVVELAGSGAPPLRTTYEPVRTLVEKGAEVVAGRPVGLLEAGPYHCTGGCLHWGLRRGDAYLDPLSLLPPALLRRGPSRLLPVFGVPEPGGAAAQAAGLSPVRRAGSWRRRCPR